MPSDPQTLRLPDPARRGRLERALAERRSIREFSARPLTSGELSQLTWSLQGITHPEGLRTTPSAGATYPLEIYVAQENGLWHYEPRPHRLVQVDGRDLRKAICRASLEQPAIRQAPAVFILAAVAARIERAYGAHDGPRYTLMEVGHAAQNLLLQAVPLGLGGVPIGAFHESRLQAVLGLPDEQRPLYLIPVGEPRGRG